MYNEEHMVKHICANLGFLWLVGSVTATIAIICYSTQQAAVPCVSGCLWKVSQVLQVESHVFGKIQATFLPLSLGSGHCTSDAGPPSNFHGGSWRAQDMWISPSNMGILTINNGDFSKAEGAMAELRLLRPSDGLWPQSQLESVRCPLIYC